MTQKTYRVSYRLYEKEFVDGNSNLITGVSSVICSEPEMNKLMQAFEQSSINDTLDWFNATEIEPKIA